MGWSALLASGWHEPPGRHRLHRPRLHLLVAGWTRNPLLHDGNWSHGLLQPPQQTRDVSGAERARRGGPFDNWKAWAFGGGRPASSSGNHAFDEYKSETLRRLEEEQQEFSSFLERLRFAKDKAEFDQFMAERRNRPAASPNEDQPDPDALIAVLLH